MSVDKLELLLILNKFSDEELMILYYLCGEIDFHNQLLEKHIASDFFPTIISDRLDNNFLKDVIFTNFAELTPVKENKDGNYYTALGKEEFLLFLCLKKFISPSEFSNICFDLGYDKKLFPSCSSHSEKVIHLLHNFSRENRLSEVKKMVLKQNSTLSIYFS